MISVLQMKREITDISPWKKLIIQLINELITSFNNQKRNKVQYTPMWSKWYFSSQYYLDVLNVNLSLVVRWVFKEHKNL